MKLWKYNFLVTGGLQQIVLLVLYCLLASIVLANTDYYRHVVFDNSLPADTYFYSQGSANGPSFLERKNWRLPVETKTFLTPPNAIRLQWESQPGGGWEAEVRSSTSVIASRNFPDTISTSGVLLHRRFPRMIFLL